MDKGLRKGDVARKDGDKGLSDRTPCKDRCCGSPGCACRNSEPPCRRQITDEWYYRWNPTGVEQLFGRVTDCCCDNFATYYRHYQRTVIVQTSGTPSTCIEEFEGEGFYRAPIRHRVWRDGALVIDETGFHNHQCSAAGPYVGWEGCRVFPGIGGNSYGEWSATCREDTGWYVEHRFMEVRTIEWRTTYQTFDNCLEGCFACCSPYGFCFETDRENCIKQGGTWNEGQHCGDPKIVCEPVDMGACCLPNGTCIQAGEQACNKAGGVWMGASIPCTASPCPPPPQGACCYPDGSCIYTDGITCANTGGNWHGTGVPCASANCPQPLLGACCYPEGFCLLQTSGQCAFNGGSWLGPNTVCTPQSCPTGACCTPGGGCIITTQQNCQGPLFGTYYGDGSTCEGRTCLGCCCVGGQGVVTSASQCFLLGGVFHGYETTCVIHPDGGSGLNPPTTVDCREQGGGERTNADIPRDTRPQFYQPTRAQILAMVGRPMGRTLPMPPGGGCSKCGAGGGLF
jgi:hypothetical protein